MNTAETRWLAGTTLQRTTTEVHLHYTYCLMVRTSALHYCSKCTLQLAQIATMHYNLSSNYISATISAGHAP